MLSLKKEIITKGEGKDKKRYTNYYLILELNDRKLSVAIEPKHFGKAWDSPQVRKSYTILDVISELFIETPQADNEEPF